MNVLFPLKRPIGTFTLLSFVFVSLTVLLTGMILSGFLRKAMLDREAVIIGDLAQSAVSRELSLDAFENFAGREVQARLERAFAGLNELSNVLQVKVFNGANRIVWSNEATLIGTAARRGGNVERAFSGTSTSIFYAPGDDLDAFSGEPVVEFYVPLRLRNGGGNAMVTGGVMAIYRSARDLNATIGRGVVLVWSVTAAGGLLLYLALFGLFRSLVRRQREAESRLSRLSSEHQRIVQLEKLSAVGMMIGEIAHQINNPLVGVVNLSELAERQSGNPAPTQALLQHIRQAGAHCSAFVQRMLDFTHLAAFQPQHCVLQEVISETVHLLNTTLQRHPEVTVDAPDAPIHAVVDPVLVRHALFNLLTNAVQASPPQGNVHVVVRPTAVDPSPGAGWAIDVLDEGTGIAPELMDKLFTPFFTTRPQGTGLGLAVCEHIAIVHGGTAKAHNRPGRGACFTLWLPERTVPDHAIQHPHR